MLDYERCSILKDCDITYTTTTLIELKRLGWYDGPPSKDYDCEYDAKLICEEYKKVDT